VSLEQGAVLLGWLEQELALLEVLVKININI